MAQGPPKKPAWYSRADSPGQLSYWDGSAWTDRSRPEPRWMAHTASLEPVDADLDSSREGPVHPHEVREPAVSGAWSAGWAPWKPNRPAALWHRGASQHPGAEGHLQRVAQPPKLGPARRPVLGLVALVAVAVAVVVSSAAFISPYATRGASQGEKGSTALSLFLAEADKECEATLPRYRDALAASDDGPTVAGAAHQVDLLRVRLASLPAVPQVDGPFDEWLASLQVLVADEDRYAAIVGPKDAGRGSGASPAGRPLGAQAAAAASQVHQQALAVEAQADRFSADIQLTACRLEPTT